MKGGRGLSSDTEVSLITGAAQGIGRSIALRLAEKGHFVALFDVDKDGLNATDELVQNIGGRSLSFKVDITDKGDVASALDQIVEQVGSVSNLVNNAGVSGVGNILELDKSQFEHIYGINVWGMINMSQQVLPDMVKRQRGRIVNVASWLGKLAKPNSAAYCSSKAAVISLTQSMSIDFSRDGVLVNAVCPGIISNTLMRERADKGAESRGAPTAADRINTIPLGRLGEPEDVANIVAFLLSDEASYMTGQALNVTGGLWKH